MADNTIATSLEVTPHKDYRPSLLHVLRFSLFYVVRFSLAVLLACVFVYFCRASQDITCYDGSVKYVCFGLLLTSAASFGAVGTSLTTYALDHQFYTGGAYYVKVLDIAISAVFLFHSCCGWSYSRRGTC